MRLHRRGVGGGLDAGKLWRVGLGSDPVGAGQHDLEQHLAAGLGLGGLDAFGLVVGEAVATGGEDHGGGDVAGDVDRVVAGAGDDFAGGEAKAGGGIAHQGDARRVEWLGGDADALGEVERHLGVAGNEAGVAGELGGDAVEFGVARVAELDGEADFAGDDVAAVGEDGELAHGAAALLAAGAHGAVDQVDDAGGGEQGVLAGGGGRGAGVAVLPDDDGVVPELGLAAGDDADLLALVFEDRALFDVELEIAVGGEGGGGGGTAVAGLVEGVAEGDTVGVVKGLDGGLVEGAGPDARAHHGLAEAGAFLVGPVDEFDGGFGFDAQLVQCAHDFQAGYDAEGAVELAAGGLAIEVAAEQDGGAGRVAAGAAGEHVAHLVGAEGEARMFAPGAEAVAAGAVDLGEGQAPDAAFGCSADFRHCHQGVPKPAAVDTLIAGECGHWRLLLMRGESCPAAGLMQRGGMLRMLLVLAVVALGGCTLIDQRTFDANAGKPPVIPPPPGPPAQIPLLVIDLGQPHPDYDQALRQAVEDAVSRKPSVRFEVATVVPGTGTPEEQVAAATAVTPEARDVARAINADGVDDDRITLSARSEVGVPSRRVEVFVR